MRALLTEAIEDFPQWYVYGADTHTVQSFSGVL